VNESTLGTVPSAALANSIPQAEPTHFVGAPGEPPFENGSHNIGATGPIPLTPVGFYKDHEGIVHLQGVAEVGTGGTIDTLFTLPPGFHPASTRLPAGCREGCDLRHRSLDDHLRRQHEHRRVRLERQGARR
jgi:hypothetical protein